MERFAAAADDDAAHERPSAVASQATSEPSPAGERPRRADFASYDEAIAFLLERANVETTRPGQVDPRAFKLERTIDLLGALGDPHRAFKSIHVAGSKGKGSVCEMAAAALQGCGLTTGLYTSPHLIDPRERIRLNGTMISHEDFTRLSSRVATVVPAIRRKWGEPTFFELFTAVAFLHFAEQAVDVAVVEVGLGGRLDSTNVVTPEVSIITSIQKEHTQLLGDTVEKIAAEKAGIIKPGVPVITCPQASDSILEVFREAARTRGTTLEVLGKDVDFSARFESAPGLGKHVEVCVSTPRSTFEHIAVPLRGTHQGINCGLVLAALDHLRARGFPIRERDVAAGLARTPSNGRLEIVSRAPRVLVDGAHNPESAAELVRSIGAYFSFGSLVVVFGCAKDKDVGRMLAQLAKGADKFIFTRAAGNARAADPRELQRRLAEVAPGKMSQTAPTVRDALAIAEMAVSRDDLIAVTGSFYIAGEAKCLYADRSAPPTAVTTARSTASGRASG